MNTRSKVFIIFGTRSKVFKAKNIIITYLAKEFNHNQNIIIKTFGLVIKVVGTDFATRSKVLIMVFLALKTFDLVPK